MTVTLTAEMLTSRVWKFHHLGGHTASEQFVLTPDGGITGHDHPSERSWRLEDGVVVLSNTRGAPTARLGTVEETPTGLVLSGPHLPNPKITLCLTERQGVLDKLGGTRKALADAIDRFGWDVGEHSYGVPGFIEMSSAKLTIGRYVSIAGDVTICFADHRTDSVSTYPFIAMRQFWPGAPRGVSDHVSRGDVVIGNDVWIGAQAFIGSGVTIGHGAVVGARAVVTRDVPPYAVVAGTPARVIRHRFSPDVIADLLAIAWWDWPEEQVNAALPLMLGQDVEAFTAAFAPPRRPATPPPSRRSWLGRKPKED